MSTQINYSYSTKRISELNPTTSLSSTDLLLIDKKNALWDQDETEIPEYNSQKITYGALSSQLKDDVLGGSNETVDTTISDPQYRNTLFGQVWEALCYLSSQIGITYNLAINPKWGPSTLPTKPETVRPYPT